MTIVILVTHLLGTGHLGRALILARAYATAGHRAVVISGGTPVPNFDYSGIELRQLPPLRSDGTNFTRLLAEDGTEVTAPYLDTRRTRISDWLSDLAPDILITELYPFGRRILADEFLAALACARALPRPALVLSSIRDILAPPSKPAKAERADEIIAQHYDAVLVHSDPQATPLELSWPVSDQLARKLRYTGYVAAPAPIPHPQKLGAGEILVSAGGGNVGQPIFEAALSAARPCPKSPLAPAGWGPERQGSDQSPVCRRIARTRHRRARAPGIPANAEPRRSLGEHVRLQHRNGSVANRRAGGGDPL